MVSTWVRQCSRSSFLALCAVVCLALVARPAGANELEEGTQDSLFLIIANSGAFGTFSPDEEEEEEYEDGCGEEEEEEDGQSYTVINLIQFLPGAMFGDPLSAITALISAGALSEATGGLFEDFSDLDGFEFFLVGNYVASDHLLFGTADEGGPAIPDATQAAMIPGLQDMGSLDPALGGLGGVATVSDAAFWAQMGLTPAQVNELLASGTLASASAAGAGENVFGFTEALFIGVAGYTVGSDGSLSSTWAPIPEPATCLLVAAGCAGAGWLRRRRSRKAA